MSLVIGPIAAGLLAPVLAALPVALSNDGPIAPAPASEVNELVRVGDAVTAIDPNSASFDDLSRLRREQDRARQVRIEQRVIIRVSPGFLGRGGPPLRDPRRGLFSEFAERSGPRFIERRTAQCVPVAGIAAVQADGPSRLILFMRDQRLISAALEKGCNARDFYSGFMIERTSDGMICAARDTLRSRTGANCGLGKLRQMIELDPEE